MLHVSGVEGERPLWLCVKCLVHHVKTVTAAHELIAAQEAAPKVEATADDGGNVTVGGTEFRFG